MNEIRLDPDFFPLAKSSMDSMIAIDSKYPDLKDRDLATYIKAVSDAQLSDMKSDMCVVIVPGVPAYKKKEVEGILKGMRFTVSTRIQIHWNDNSDYLDAVFQIKDGDQ
jgi:hypothetical protein